MSARPPRPRDPRRADPHDNVATEAPVSGVDLNVTADPEAMIGHRYRITGMIGEGGMGLVYEAWDTQVGRRVAIKVVRSDTTDSKYLSRFRRELEVTSKLRHPSTIRVFEHGETKDRRPYMVMELLTGNSLAQRLEAGPLSEIEALQIAQQVAESLSEAHEHGVYHRDLKPDNIFIETVGVTKVVKVLDFGIAGGMEATRLTQAGEVFGTPQYMSPEQCNGQRLDHRTDIYSLACILFEMLEGRPPFSCETPMATMLKHVRAPVPPMRRAHPITQRVIALGLQKDRSRRIQNAGHFAELLTEAISGLQTPSQRAAPVPFAPAPSVARIAAPGPSPERAGKVIAVLGALTALGLVALIVMGVGQTPNAAPSNAPSTDAAPSLPTNRALIDPEVAGVTVLLDGSVQCETPCWIEVPVGDGREHEIRLRKAGFHDAVAPWRPESVGQLLPSLPELRRAEPAMAAAPSAAVAPPVVDEPTPQRAPSAPQP